LLAFLRMRVDVSAEPVTVVVEIVVLCSDRDRAEAELVIVVACFVLSVADREPASCAVTPAVLEPLIIGIPPCTVPVMLN
jgi:hypothetical protein